MSYFSNIGPKHGFFWLFFLSTVLLHYAIHPPCFEWLLLLGRSKSNPAMKCLWMPVPAWMARRNRHTGPRFIIPLALQSSFCGFRYARTIYNIPVGDVPPSPTNFTTPSGAINKPSPTKVKNHWVNWTEHGKRGWVVVLVCGLKSVQICKFHCYLLLSTQVSALCTSFLSSFLLRSLTLKAFIFLCGIGSKRIRSGLLAFFLAE